MAEQKHALDFNVDELKEYIATARTSTVERLLAEETAEDGGNRETAIAALEARLEDLKGKQSGSDTKSDTDTGEPSDPESQAGAQPEQPPTRAQTELDGETEEQRAVRTAKKQLSGPPPGGGHRQVDVATPNRQKAATARAQEGMDPTEGPWEGTGVHRVSSPAPARIPGDVEAPERHVAAARPGRSAAAAAPTRFDPHDTRNRQTDKG